MYKISKIKPYLGGLAFLIGILMLFFLREPEIQDPIKSVDTYIPRNHVLIPLELENSANFSHFAAETFRANLYSKKRLLVQNARFVRSPFNANLYAVLLHESDADHVVLSEGPFRVSMQNPKKKKQAKPPNRITYGEQP